MKFFSRLDRPPCSPVSLGSPTSDVYEERINAEGEKVLVCTGKTSVNDRVQASFKESLVYSALARAGAGDDSALHRAQAFYGDVTKLPKNLAEAHQLLLNMDKNFESLPVEIKRVYDNSPTKFVKALSDGTVAPVIADYISKHDKRFNAASNPAAVSNPAAASNPADASNPAAAQS